MLLNGLGQSKAVIYLGNVPEQALCYVRLSTVLVLCFLHHYDGKYFTTV